LNPLSRRRLQSGRLFGPAGRALAAQAADHLDLFADKADLLRAAAPFVVAPKL
jgi:hypothetical protein